MCRGEKSTSGDAEMCPITDQTPSGRKTLQRARIQNVPAELKAFGSGNLRAGLTGTAKSVSAERDLEWPCRTRRNEAPVYEHAALRVRRCQGRGRSWRGRRRAPSLDIGEGSARFWQPPVRAGSVSGWLRKDQQASSTVVLKRCQIRVPSAQEVSDLLG